MTTKVKLPRADFESVQIGSWQSSLPSALCTNKEIFDTIFSTETWKTVLKPDQRERLMTFLPPEVLRNPELAQQTMEGLFSRELVNFGINPLDAVFTKLDAGHFDPEVVEIKSNIVREWRRESIRLRKTYHTKLLKQIVISREAHLKKLTCANLMKRSRVANINKDPSTAPARPVTSSINTSRNQIRKQGNTVLTESPFNLTKETKSSDPSKSKRTRSATTTEEPPATETPTKKKQKFFKKSGNKSKDLVIVTTQSLAQSPTSVIVGNAFTPNSTATGSTFPNHLPEPFTTPKSTTLLESLNAPVTPSTLSGDTSLYPSSSFLSNPVRCSPILASQLQSRSPLPINLGSVGLRSAPQSSMTLNYTQTSMSGKQRLIEEESSSDEFEFESIEPTIGFTGTTESARSQNVIINTPCSSMYDKQGTAPETATSLSGIQKCSTLTDCLNQPLANTLGTVQPGTTSNYSIPSQEMMSVEILNSGLSSQMTTPIPQDHILHNNGHTLTQLTSSASTEQTDQSAIQSVITTTNMLDAISSAVPPSGKNIPQSSMLHELVNYPPETLKQPFSTESSEITASEQPMPRKIVKKSSRMSLLDADDLNVNLGAFPMELGVSLEVDGSNLDMNSMNADGSINCGMDKIDDLSVLDGNPFDSIPNLSEELDGLDLDMVDSLFDFEKLLSEEKQYASFFSLIRDVLCSTKDHRMTLLCLEKTIRKWALTPGAALNSWYMRSDNWNSALIVGLNFLAGIYQDVHPEDFVPYIEYKYKTKYYQWIGAGRDGDNNLGPLCTIWMDNLDKLPTIKKSDGECEEPDEEEDENDDSDTPGGDDPKKKTKRPQTPPPPRCTTDWTVRPSTVAEKTEFRAQERIRFDNPHKACTYRMYGYESVVGPVKGVYSSQTGVTNKARGHSLLVDERPTFVTILALVRDSVARLPNGEGTRSEICEMLRDSAFLAPEASNVTLNSVVSGALDRLHYERDPCVRYDSHKKSWIYLHRDRTQEQFERLHHNRSYTKSTKSRNTCTRKPRKPYTRQQPYVDKALLASLGSSSSSQSSSSVTESPAAVKLPTPSSTTVTTFGEPTPTTTTAPVTVATPPNATSVIINPTPQPPQQTRPVATTQYPCTAPVTTAQYSCAPTTQYSCTVPTTQYSCTVPVSTTQYSCTVPVSTTQQYSCTVPVPTTQQYSCTVPTTTQYACAVPTTQYSCTVPTSQEYSCPVSTPQYSCPEPKSSVLPALISPKTYPGRIARTPGLHTIPNNRTILSGVAGLPSDVKPILNVSSSVKNNNEQSSTLKDVLEAATGFRFQNVSAPGSNQVYTAGPQMLNQTLLNTQQPTSSSTVIQEQLPAFNQGPPTARLVLQNPQTPVQIPSKCQHQSPAVQQLQISNVSGSLPGVAQSPTGIAPGQILLGPSAVLKLAGNLRLGEGLRLAQLRLPGNTGNVASGAPVRLPQHRILLARGALPGQGSGQGVLLGQTSTGQTVILSAASPTGGLGGLQQALGGSVGTGIMGTQAQLSHIAVHAPQMEASIGSQLATTQQNPGNGGTSAQNFNFGLPTGAGTKFGVISNLPASSSDICPAANYTQAKEINGNAQPQAHLVPVSMSANSSSAASIAIPASMLMTPGTASASTTANNLPFSSNKCVAMSQASQHHVTMCSSGLVTSGSTSKIAQGTAVQAMGVPSTLQLQGIAQGLQQGSHPLASPIIIRSAQGDFVSFGIPSHLSLGRNLQGLKVIPFQAGKQTVLARIVAPGPSSNGSIDPITSVSNTSTPITSGGTIHVSQGALQTQSLNQDQTVINSALTSVNTQVGNM